MRLGRTLPPETHLPSTWRSHGGKGWWRTFFIKCLTPLIPHALFRVHLLRRESSKIKYCRALSCTNTYVANAQPPSSFSNSIHFGIVSTLMFFPSYSIVRWRASLGLYRKNGSARARVLLLHLSSKRRGYRHIPLQLIRVEGYLRKVASVLVKLNHGPRKS